jgi:hypothetical protein
MLCLHNANVVFQYDNQTVKFNNSANCNCRVMRDLLHVAADLDVGQKMNQS